MRREPLALRDCMHLRGGFTDDLKAAIGVRCFGVPTHGNRLREALLGIPKREQGPCYRALRPVLPALVLLAVDGRSKTRALSRVLLEGISRYL